MRATAVVRHALGREREREGGREGGGREGGREGGGREGGRDGGREGGKAEHSRRRRIQGEMKEHGERLSLG